MGKDTQINNPDTEAQEQERRKEVEHEPYISPDAVSTIMSTKPTGKEYFGVKIIVGTGWDLKQEPEISTDIADAVSKCTKIKKEKRSISSKYLLIPSFVAAPAALGWTKTHINMAKVKDPESAVIDSMRSKKRRTKGIIVDKKYLKKLERRNHEMKQSIERIENIRKDMCRWYSNLHEKVFASKLGRDIVLKTIRRFGEDTDLEIKIKIAESKKNIKIGTLTAIVIYEAKEPNRTLNLEPEKHYECTLIKDTIYLSSTGIGFFALREEDWVIFEVVDDNEVQKP